MKKITDSELYTMACAYIENDGNKSATAKQLGISRTHMYRIIEDPRFNMIAESSNLTRIQFEPAMLKLWMLNTMFADMGDYFDTNNRFIGWDKLTAQQRARIKEFEVKNTQYGQNVKIKLHDAMKANELLAKQHGIYNELSIDLTMKDVIEPEDWEYLEAKYNWNNLDDDDLYR